MQKAELDPFFFRMGDFFGTGRHFGTGTAVNTVHFIGAEPVSHTGGIHRNVSAADNRNNLGWIQRCVCLIFLIGLHQISAG